MKTRILYSSREVRETIIDIFSSSKGRRVAITAFVGKGAEAYLPKPEGLELVCWAKAGGTNPYALRNLIQRGTVVSFVDSLHMKVYWTEDKGVVITSANLSTNALGAGNLREVGVYLPSEQLDIRRLLSSLKRRPVTEQELLRLDKLHNEYQKFNSQDSKSKQIITFEEWYSLPYRPKWKIGWGESKGNFSKVAKSIAKVEYNVDEPRHFVLGKKNDYKQKDWVLSFFLNSNSVSELIWMYVDYVVRVPKSDKKAFCYHYPYQAVQVWSLRHHSETPFHIDRRFRSAFLKAVRSFGIERLHETAMVKPTKKLIDLILEHY